MSRLEFKGRSLVEAHHYSVPYRSLELDSELSCNIEADGAGESIVVHGDNLEALKALLPRYAGRVDCAYIDPPYNTGEEKWKYNDRVRGPLAQKWLGKVVDAADMERHDKWLCICLLYTSPS